MTTGLTIEASSATLRRLPNMVNGPTSAPVTLTAVLESLQRLCERNTDMYARLDRADRGCDSPSSAPNSPPGSFIASPNANALKPLEAPKSEPLTFFHSRVVPAMSLANLARALEQHTGCGEACLSVALVLFTRFCDTTSLRPTAHMMHRLYVACLLVAMKAHIDRFPSNRSFARVAGISVQEMNRLERTLVEGVAWSVIVHQQQVDRVMQHLVLASGDAATLERLKKSEKIVSESSTSSDEANNASDMPAKSDDTMYSACAATSTAVVA